MRQPPSTLMPFLYPPGGYFSEPLVILRSISQQHFLNMNPRSFSGRGVFVKGPGPGQPNAWPSPVWTVSSSRAPPSYPNSPNFKLEESRSNLEKNIHLPLFYIEFPGVETVYMDKVSAKPQHPHMRRPGSPAVVTPIPGLPGNKPATVSKRGL